MPGFVRVDYILILQGVLGFIVCEYVLMQSILGSAVFDIGSLCLNTVVLKFRFKQSLF